MSEAKANPKQPRKRKKKGGLLKEFISISIYLLSVLVLTYLLITFVVQRTVVSGDSMAGTLTDGENLLVNKITYRFHEPKRFDIIVFPYSQEAQTYYIKRVIGLPGETVYIDATGAIYINDERLEENFGKEIIQKPGLAENKVYLGANEYFVLGDNRNHSSDSRDPAVGPIERSRIVGKAWLRIYPFSKWGKLK